MSTQPAQPAPPTVADQQAIATAGAGAAAPAIDRGASPAEVQQIVNDAMASVRDSREVKLSDEDIAKVAEQLVGQFEQMGAFEKPPAPETVPPPASAAEATAGVVAPGLVPPADDAAPSKQTFADKFFGTGKR